MDNESWADFVGRICFDFFFCLLFYCGLILLFCSSPTGSCWNRRDVAVNTISLPISPRWRFGGGRKCYISSHAIKLRYIAWSMNRAILKFTWPNNIACRLWARTLFFTVHPHASWLANYRHMHAWLYIIICSLLLWRFLFLYPFYFFPSFFSFPFSYFYSKSSMHMQIYFNI